MSTKFQDRLSDNPNRRKITIISQSPTEIIADIERADAVKVIDGVPQVGTPINAQLLNEWDDKVENASAIATGMQGEINQLAAKIYPVGSVYFSAGNDSPAALFGGEWEQITESFIFTSSSLLNADENRPYKLGDTGGEKEHVLTIDEMPAHSHQMDFSSNEALGSYTGLRLSSLPWTNDLGFYDGSLTVGGGAAHNNMPPYITLNAWWRRA